MVLPKEYDDPEDGLKEIKMKNQNVAESAEDLRSPRSSSLSKSSPNRELKDPAAEIREIKIKNQNRAGSAVDFSLPRYSSENPRRSPRLASGSSPFATPPPEPNELAQVADQVTYQSFKL